MLPVSMPGPMRYGPCMPVVVLKNSTKPFFFFQPKSKFERAVEAKKAELGEEGMHQMMIAKANQYLFWI